MKNLIIEVDILKGLIECIEETYDGSTTPGFLLSEDTGYINGKELLKSKQRELFKLITEKETFDHEYIIKTIEEFKTKNND